MNHGQANGQHPLRRNSEHPAGSLAAELAVFPIPTGLIDRVAALELEAKLAADMRRTVARFMFGHLADPIDDASDADVLRTVARYLRTFAD